MRVQDYCCTGVCRGGGLTDDGAALAVSGQLVVEDDEEHGEAEHQRHLEGVALAAPQWQGEAHHVGQDDEDAGQHESDEGVEVFDGELNLRGVEGGRCTIRNTTTTLDLCCFHPVGSCGSCLFFLFSFLI